MLRSARNLTYGFMGTVRADAWWIYKIGPVLAFAFAEVYLHRIPPLRATLLVVLLMVSAFGIAAYGHVVNDAFDADADRRVGKRNRVATWQVWIRAVVSLLLLGLGFLPWVFVEIPALALWLLAGNSLLLFLYSAPPFRLKERGGWGLLTDAGYAHVLPVLFLFAMFEGEPFPSPFHVLWPVLGSLWALCFGVRGIIIHQLWDRENDELTGVHTYVIQRGAEAARRLVVRFVFPAELAFLAMIGGTLYFLAPIPFFVLLGYGILWGLGWLVHVFPRKLHPDPAPLDLCPYVPLVSFYSVWPAVALVVALMVEEPANALLFAVQIVLFPTLLWRHLKELGHLIGGIIYQTLWALRRGLWIVRAGVLDGYGRFRK